MEVKKKMKKKVPVSLTNKKQKNEKSNKMEEIKT